MSDLNVSTPYTFYGPLKNIPITPIRLLATPTVAGGVAEVVHKCGDEKHFVINDFTKLRRPESIKLSETLRGSKDAQFDNNGGDSNESDLEGIMTGTDILLNASDMQTAKCGMPINESAFGSQGGSEKGIIDGNDDGLGPQNVQPVINGSSRKSAKEQKPMYLMSFLLGGGKQVYGNEQQYKTRKRRFSGSSKSSCSSGSAKFPRKLWDIVNSCTTGAISWSLDGTRILVNYKQFQEEYLSTNSFKTDNVASFIRQLNLYGFRKVTSSKNSSSSSSISSVFAQIKAMQQDADENNNGWLNRSIGSPSSSRQSNEDETHEFKNENFIRGREELLVNINRTVNVTKTAKPKPSIMNPYPAAGEMGKAPYGLTKKGKPRAKPQKSKVPSVLSKTIRNSTTAELQYAVQLINEMLNNSNSDSIINGLSQEMLSGRGSGDVIIENDLLMEALPNDEEDVAMSGFENKGPRVITTFNTDSGYSATFYEKDECDARKELLNSQSLDQYNDEDSLSHELIQ